MLKVTMMEHCLNQDELWTRLWVGSRRFPSGTVSGWRDQMSAAQGSQECRSSHAEHWTATQMESARSSKSFENEVRAFQKETLKTLHLMKIVQQTHTEQLSAVIKNLSEKGKVEEDPIVEGPFQSLEAFLDFESELENSASKRNCLMKYIKSVGGASSRDYIFRVLARILDRSVAKEHSLFGAKRKRRFSDARTWKLICSSLTEATSVNSPTLKDIEQATMLWLRHVPEADQRHQQKGRNVETED